MPQAAPMLGNHLLILLFPQSPGDAAVVISRHFCCPGRCSLVLESKRERKLLQEVKRNRGWQGLQQAAGEGRARPAQPHVHSGPPEPQDLRSAWSHGQGGSGAGSCRAGAGWVLEEGRGSPLLRDSRDFFLRLEAHTSDTFHLLRTKLPPPRKGKKRERDLRVTDTGRAEQAEALWDFQETGNL